MTAMKAAAMKKVMKPSMKSMKPAMKAMKVMKVMKAMKKAMKVSKIARGVQAKSLVLKGRREKTSGGLAAKDLMLNKNGRVVSKKQHAAGTKQTWMAAVKEARKELGIAGFCPVGGKSPEGKALYAKAKTLM